MKTPEGKESPGALAGVPPAAVLIAVAGEHTLRLRYEESIGRYGRGRNEEMGVGGCCLLDGRVNIDHAPPPPFETEVCRLVVQASARGVGVEQIFFDEAAGRARSYSRNSRAVLIQHPLDTQTRPSHLGRLLSDCCVVLWHAKSCLYLRFPFSLVVLQE